MTASATTAVPASATRWDKNPALRLYGVQPEFMVAGLHLFAAADSRCTDYQNLGREANGTDQKAFKQARSRRARIASSIAPLLAKS